MAGQADRTVAASGGHARRRCIARLCAQQGIKIIHWSFNDRGTPVEITLPPEFEYDGVAEVKFENRTVAIGGGKISDEMRPLERHVYVARIAK